MVEVKSFEIRYHTRRHPNSLAPVKYGFRVEATTTGSIPTIHYDWSTYRELETVLQPSNLVKEIFPRYAEEILSSGGLMINNEWVSVSEKDLITQTGPEEEEE